MTIILPKPLVIKPERFLEGYNYPIEAFVESKPTYGKSDGLRYLSYSHALRLLHELFPELSADCVVNPKTGGYIFREVDDSGYFVKAYLHDGEAKSPDIYFAVLGMDNAPVLPDEKVIAKGSLKTFPGPVGELPYPKATSALFNKAYYRAITKAIAVVTGIGLKLWTGDDLGEDIQNQKLTMIARVQDMATQLKKKGVAFDLPPLDVTTNSGDIKNLGRQIKELLEQPA